MNGNSKKCLIIAGGEYAPFEEDVSFDFVIACDKGFEYAEKMGIKYDMVLGDFDSANSHPMNDVPVIELPKEKDDTDTIYAVKYALEKGYREIYIICALGGRLDHTIANLQTATYIALNEGRCHLYGVDNELHTIKDDSTRIRKRENAYISVFSLSECSLGVTIKGTKYGADSITLSYGLPLGVSNEWNEDEAVISVKHGIIAVVISKRN